MESDGPMTQVVQAKCPFCHNVLRIPADWLSQPMHTPQILQADDPGERTGRRGLPGGRDRTPPARFRRSTGGGDRRRRRRCAAPPIRSASMTIPSRSRLRPSQKGKGWIIATVLLVSLSTVAVLVVVPRAAVARAVPRQAD